MRRATGAGMLQRLPLDMRRVLIVAEKFPPFNASGSARPFYFAKYLHQFGYAPTVVAAAVPAGEAKDDSLLRELPEQVRILRSPRIVSPFIEKASPFGRATPSGGEAAPSAAPAPRSSMWKRLGPGAQYFRWWLHWELDWGASATLAALVSARRERPDIVWVSGPHFRAFVIGVRLARWLGRPLVLDVRDPWTYGSLWNPATPAIAAAERGRAQRALSAADRVIFTSPLTERKMREQFTEVSASKWLTITNGFDDVAVEPLRDWSHEKCLFRYVGMLNRRRTPQVLLESFRRAAEDPEFRATAVLELIGDAGGHETMVSLAPGCAVHFRPPVSRADSLRYMSGSDVNILLQTISDGQDVISGKAFDYLHAGKPILAVVDPSGGDAALMTETGAGLVTPWTDVPAITAAFQQLWRRWKDGVGAARPMNASAYSRRALTAKLAGVFDEVLAERSSAR